MLSQKDFQQIAERGISEADVNRQLEQFRTGFPFLRIEAAASVRRGIMAVTKKEQAEYVQAWQKYKDEGHKIVKFVPASGAASRMFKDLFAFLEADYDTPTTPFEKEFFSNLRQFAFRKALCSACKADISTNVCGLLEAGR